METVKSTMKRLLAKRKKVRVRPDTILGAFEGGIRLADKAQIPLGGPVFALAGEIITMLQVASDNNATAAGLIRTIESYTEKLEDFALATRLQSRPPDDPAARQMKKAAQNFASITQSIKQDLEAQGGGNGLVRFLASKAVRDRLSRCSQDLQQAHQGFHTDQLTVLAWDLSAASRIPTDEFVFSALPLNYQEFEILDNVQVPKRRPSFWAGTVRAQVEGQVRVVKVFHPKSGGQEAFEKSLLQLGSHPSVFLPSIHGYSSASNPPFIAFKFSNVTPLLDYLWLLHAQNPDAAVVVAWNMMIDIKDALQFIHENEFPMVYDNMLDTLRGAMVNDSGKVILAPVMGEETDLSHFDHFSYAYMVSMYWSSALRDVAARPFRSLGYAMATSSDVLFSSRPTLADTGQFLRGMWPTGQRRCLLWPDGAENLDDILPGDVGVFDIKPGRVARFRKLGDMRSELAVSVGFSRYHKHQYNNVYSDALKPPEHVAEDNSWRYCPQKHVWDSALQDREYAYARFFERAPQLAEQFRVLPENLVLVMKTLWETSTSELIMPPGSAPGSMELWFHIDEAGQPTRWYWSQKGELPEGAERDLRGAAGSLNDPWVKKPRAMPAVYAQFEASDFLQATSDRLVNTFKIL